MNPEELRLQEAQDRTAHWRRYFPHDHARSRAYRWGEDGIGGITDNRGRLCLALALWNGRDPSWRSSIP
jgi:hypothetical protein